MSSIQRRLLNSLYLSLLLSVACLGYAEIGQKLPETPFVYGLILLALWAAYWCEGKYALSIGLSNLVAGVVVFIGGLWLLLNMGRQLPEMDSPFALPRTLVSGAGPVMCFLLLAKLFRPKAVSDYWMLHLLGLVQVILACVLAMGSRMDRDAPLFPLLLLSYLACEAWAQRWFYLGRESNHASDAPPAATTTPRIIRLSLRPVGLFLSSLLLAVIIFFSLPQGGLDASIFRGTDHSETGASQNIDLNAEGEVQISDEQVMRVWVTRNGENVILPETFRLRGAVLSNPEQNGVWRPFPPVVTPGRMFRDPSPRRTGRGLRFEFDIDVNKIQELGRPRAGRGGDMNVPLFLADPPGGDFLETSFNMPSLTTEDMPLNSNVFEGQTWLTLKRKLPSVHLFHEYTGRYSEREWEQIVNIVYKDFYEQYKTILKKVPQRIALSGRIAQLTKDALAAAKLPENAPPKEQCLALERYLSSAEFVYSLERRKQDTSIDPTEDFLLNVKQGHCERFAAAMAVMLRTQNIPARIVVGYRGAEWNEIGGFHIIRQLHAHAWVEALIAEETVQGGKKLRWLVLDPSPLGEVTANTGVMTTPLSFARFLWEFFILDFSGQAQRARLMSLLQGTWLGHLINWWQTLNWWQAAVVSVIAVALLIGLVWGIVRLVRWVRRRHHLQQLEARQTVPFFARLLRLLSQGGWEPAPGQTAAEFARAVRPQLASAPTTADVAGVPEAVVTPFYDVRYGGRTLSDQQETQVRMHLDALQKAMT
jgi:hypothetical protein